MDSPNIAANSVITVIMRSFRDLLIKVAICCSQQMLASNERAKTEIVSMETTIRLNPLTLLRASALQTEQSVAL